MSPAVLNTLLGAVMGALLGSLATIVVFRDTVTRLEERLAALTEKVGEIKVTANTAATDAGRAWRKFRELGIVVKERTEEHPKYEPRDTGEGPSNE